MLNVALETWNSATLAIGDFFFARLLAKSHDATLIALAFATVAILLLVRRVATHQATLRSAVADARKLRELLASTPREDKVSRSRHRRTRAEVARIRLRAELPAALFSLLIVSAIVSWGWQRLQYVAPQPEDPIRLRIELPAAYVGGFVHVVPQANVAIRPSLVQTVQLNGGKPPQGRAEWDLTFQSEGMYRVEIRAGSHTVAHHIRVGGPFYSPPRQSHQQSFTTVVRLKPFKPFGFVGALRRIGLPAWFVAYFVIVLVGFQLFKRLLRLH